LTNCEFINQERQKRRYIGEQKKKKLENQKRNNNI